MRRLIVILLTVMVVITAGSVVFVILLMFMCAGLVIIENPRDIFRLRPGMVLLSNHPDAFDFMYEVILVPAIFFAQAILHPLKFAPKIPLDDENFTKKWWYFLWLRLFAIPTVRGKGKGRKNAQHEGEEFLAAMWSKKLMIYFGPGRDRTGKGQWYSKSGKHYIRRPTNAIGRLLAGVPDILVCIIWIDAGDVPIQHGKRLFSWPKFRPIRVRFGPALNSNQFVGMDPHEITKVIATRQLETADKISNG